MSDLLLVSEAAKQLRCSEFHLRNLINRGQLQALRIGTRGMFRIPKEELEKLLNRTQRKPAA